MVGSGVIQVGVKYGAVGMKPGSCRTQPHEHMKAWACLLVSPTVTPVNS